MWRSETKNITCVNSCVRVENQDSDRYKTRDKPLDLVLIEIGYPVSNRARCQVPTQSRDLVVSQRRFGGTY